MKFSEIEKQLRKHIEERENSVQPENINLAVKDETWLRVQEKMGIKSKQHMIWWPSIAAASIILFLAVSFGFHEIRKRDQTIARLQAELNSKKEFEHRISLELTDLEKQLAIEKNKPAQIDTVIQTRIIYQPSIPKEEAVVNATIEPEFLEEADWLIDNESGENLPVFTGNQEDIQSFKIEYGKPEKNGTTPWTFTVKYN